MTDWKQQITDLRIRFEKATETLKELEKKGTEEAARDAFWLTDSNICSGSEFKNIEKNLIKKGYKYP